MKKPKNIKYELANDVFALCSNYSIVRETNNSKSNTRFIELYIKYIKPIILIISHRVESTKINLHSWIHKHNILYKYT